MEIKDSKGAVGEAYDLVTTKENALDILSGRKKVEFRKANKFYDSVFLDVDDSGKMKIKEIFAVHFHDSNNTWYLDIFACSIAIYHMHPDEKETMKYLRENNLHEMDEILAKSIKLPIDSDEVEWYYSLKFDGYIGTNLNVNDLSFVIDKVNFDDYDIDKNTTKRASEIRVKKIQPAVENIYDEEEQGLLNKNFWNMYKDSEKGKKAIEVFSYDQEPEKKAEAAVRLAEWADSQLHEVFCDVDGRIKFCSQLWYNFQEVKEFDEKLQNVTRESYAEFIEMFDMFYYDDSDEKEVKATERVIIPRNDFRWKASRIDLIAFYLYFYYDFFKPVFLPDQFNVIQQNCDAIGLRLPPIPRSTDYMAYLMYYYDMCVAFNNFQKKNNLTDAEFCACLYDYAPMLVEEKNFIELPKPTNVWLTGAAPGDFDILDNLGEGDISANPNMIWACNERTKRGDIVIIYCRTPRSYIHSIWRAKNDGIFNPFDYYHCRVNVCEGIRVPPITSKELKADPYFSQVPIVRKNLQGIKGVEFTAEDYSELLRFIAQKGGDVSALPKLFEAGNYNFGEVKIEKDVEEKILIPMLEKLGYSSDDWTRQLSLKAGRNQKAIPDFVFFAKGERHFENAPFIIEAKYDMAYITDQQNAFTQALSYARMLRSKLMGICDKKRIILYKVNDDGSCSRNQPIYENHWETIYSDDLEGAKLKKIIGRDVVRNI